MTLQAGGDKHGSVTGSGPLLAITPGQTTHNRLCRPPEIPPTRETARMLGVILAHGFEWRRRHPKKSPPSEAKFPGLTPRTGFLHYVSMFDDSGPPAAATRTDI